MEEWKPIEGYEGLYEISNYGQVNNIKRNKLLKPYSSTHLIYPRVNLSKNKKAKLHYHHRLLAKAFIPNPEDLPEINHKDGDKTNNSLENLEWVSHVQNVRHAFEEGLNLAATKLQGENSSMSKLTDGEVVRIRSLYKPYFYSMNKLAKEFGVSVQNIYMIVSGKTWKHLL